MEEGGYTLNNLITSLLLFINNPEVRDTDYQIASCLLEHCYEIKNMTIQELAEKSYVSVSTINRFLKMYGFSRYSIFKSVFYQHVLSRYNQMRGRLSEWMPGQVECMLHTVLSEAHIVELQIQCDSMERQRFYLRGYGDGITYLKKTGML